MEVLILTITDDMNEHYLKLLRISVLLNCGQNLNLFSSELLLCQLSLVLVSSHYKQEG